MPRGWRTACSLTVGAALILLCSGCVFLRLLQLKRQLADFDRNFAVRTEHDLRIECLRPLLLTDDLRFLGFHPATTKSVGTAEQWHLRWVKQRAANAVEQGNFEIAFDLIFTGQKLSAFHIPEKYLAFLPKDTVVATLRSLGGARVDKSNRSVESEVTSGLKDNVTAKGVGEMLGAPTDRRMTGEREVLHYHFTSADPAHQGKDLDLEMIFDAKTGDLRGVDGKLPAIGRIHVNFGGPESAAATSPR